MTSPDLMTPREVAEQFRIDGKTLSRWALAGRLVSIKTPAGHRRYFRVEVNACLRGRPLTEEQRKELLETGEVKS